MSDTLKTIYTSKCGNWHIRQRNDSPILYYHIKKPDGSGWISKSAKTKDLDEAKTITEDLYAEMRLRKRVGLASVSIKFSVLCEGYITTLTGRDKKDYEPVVRRYILPFLGERDAETISDKDIHDYREWRKNYWISGPGKNESFVEYERGGKIIRRPILNPKVPTITRLQREWVALRGVFNYGVKKGLLKEISIPNLNNERAAKRKSSMREIKAAFEQQELQTFISFLNTWKSPLVDPERILLLRDLVILLCESGIRPGTESDSLQWKHVRPGKTDGGLYRLRITVTGKTGTHSPAVGIEGGRALWRIRTRRKAFLQGDKTGWNAIAVNRDEFVLALPNGERVATESLAGTFEIALRECGLLYDTQGRKRSIFSCRHTFARFQLNGNCNIYWLSSQMNTSVPMLENHYGDTTAFRQADQLKSIL